MKFTKAWANVAQQNGVLRIAILTVCLASMISLLILLKFALKAPLIIDRGCASRAIQTDSDQAPTEAEIHTFIRQVLPQRFDTKSIANPDLFSLEEMQNRELEQKQLSSHEVRQTILVNSITGTGDTYVVDTDRILAMGDLRSALRFPLKVKIGQTQRSQADPYGLVLLNVSKPKSKGGANETK